MLAKAAWQSTQLDCVHIHCCGNGHLGFRLTAGHFGKEPQSNQRALAPPLGTSPRLGVPVIRQRGLTGRLRSKADQERLASHRSYRWRVQPTKLCRYLCCDGDGTFTTAIAGKPTSLTAFDIPIRSALTASQIQALAAIAVTSTRIPSTAKAATPTAARTGQGLAKKRL